MINTDLLTALLAVIDGTAVSDCTRVTLRASALTLAQRPNLAADLGLVLTEHTAPKSDPGALFMLHAHDAGCCASPSDAAVHRIEVLPPEFRRALELWAGVARYEPGETVSSAVMITLLRLGLATDAGGITAQLRATARGRAWLEAHPREGGEAR